MTNTKKKNFSGIISAFLTLIIAIAMIFIIYAAVSADNKSVFGYRIFIVATGSMQGTINAGELIITKSVPPNSLKVKDIISFVSDDPEIIGKMNTHRIVKIVGNRFYTKGDANPQVDSNPTAPSKIAGKVIFHSAFVGFIIKSLSKPLYMLIFLVLPIAYIAITDIRYAAKKARSVISNNSGENENAENNDDITSSVQNNVEFDNNNTDNIDHNNDSSTSDGL